jgi:hypothetical protein
MSRIALIGVCLALSAGVAACGTGSRAPAPASRTATTPTSSSRAAGLAHWTAFVHVGRPLDLAGPRRDGSVVLAAAGKLWLLQPSGRVAPFAPAYASPGGEEPYIALFVPSPKAPACFGPGTVYALRLAAPRGVVAITPAGRVKPFASLSAPGLIDGIAFDRTGHFGGRLLVTINAGSKTTVDAIDCRGHVTTITAGAPRVEGGIAVAPATFGRFAGDLIAPDENGGRIWAVTPQGKSMLVANSGLPHGGDIGVESEAFIPNARRYEALVADRFTPGNRHPGDDVVLRIGSAALTRAGVRGGDLVVVTEGGARTDAIRCGPTSCQVRHVADGPAVAHGEGHVSVLAR